MFVVTNLQKYLMNLPPLAPRVGIVANMQANIVIEILMKRTRDNIFRV